MPTPSPIKPEQLINRALNKDGTSNLVRESNRKPFHDIYHFLLSVTWPRFFFILLSSYVLINLGFGSVYFFLGASGMDGVKSTSGIEFFLECFFFSVQTVSTIGYGHVSPISLPHNIFVAIEAFIGIMSVAMMTGLFFSRFSRPTAKVAFSHIALMTNYMGKKTLLFRMANARQNVVVEAMVNLVLLKSVVTPEGIRMRQQIDLKPIRQNSMFFAASWTVGHIIDETSPLFAVSHQELIDARAEILVSLNGFDETFSQNIRARHSYVASELVYDRHFADFTSVVDNKLKVDISKISDLQPL